MYMISEGAVWILFTFMVLYLQYTDKNINKVQKTANNTIRKYMYTLFQAARMFAIHPFLEIKYWYISPI